MGSLWSKKEEDSSNRSKRPKTQGIAIKRATYLQTPYVLKRVSSMFFDEDGHLAHEFYEECQVQSQYGVRWSMKRVYNKLVPQGEIELTMPTLHVDFPVLLMENI